MNVTSINTTCLNASVPGNSSLSPCQPPRNAPDNTLRDVFSIVVMVAVAIIMVGMGCAVDAKKVAKHFKNPTGILTGLFCQFVIMPVFAYCWARIFTMDSPETLALLIVGSCPGGTMSNIVAYWVGGDMALSATMTSVSVVASLGMLPLLLFIYSKVLGEGGINVPFDTIGITLALIVGPLAIGSLLRFKFPKVAEKVLKIFGFFGILTLIVVISMSIYIFHPFWSFRTSLIVIAILYPLCGMVLGYAISSIVSLSAKPLRLTHRQRRTVSVETGIQNQQIASAIIQLSGFPLPLTGRMLVLPLMYGISQLLWSAILMGVYHLASFLRKGKCPQLKDQEEDEEDKPSHTTVTAVENLAFEEKE